MYKQMSLVVVNVVVMTTYKVPIQALRQTALGLQQQGTQPQHMALQYNLVKISTTSVL